MDGFNFVYCLVPKFIGNPVRKRSFHARACKPTCERVWVVIASLGTFLESWHPSKFGAPYDERIREQTPLLQVP